MKKSFYSHGKLLLTAEYLVLDGVSALALPTQKGQWLYVEESSNEPVIKWKSIDEHDIVWFETSLTLKNDYIVTTNEAQNDDVVTKTLIDILNAAKKLNPNFLTSNIGYEIESKLEFNRAWGLGSSSTLINNIAQWAKVNAFELLNLSFGGSGYDIACAQYDYPIIYTRIENKPTIKEVNFDPPFADHLFFIYLNEKQDSKESIKRYQSLPLKDFDKAETAVTEITAALVTCTALPEFQKLIDTHEDIISNIIKTETIKSRVFPDYSGSIKSLGGWGGDFVLATGTPSDMEYFRSKGYTTIISYKNMIL
ncbi:GHMP kinase [Aquimarina sp. U1-2]|uniref:GYDIA family GHMP kinase n=1 Tax=Aquimarina sp. U1-2 TaxID=2823141 RepID=UPI001AECA7C0|nr:GYDIA family GHMP kinase [Aquimarina sp. U1-2]MBP2832594.1 GHMP kinase [Aquimarina sp. U1-2]